MDLIRKIALKIESMTGQIYSPSLEIAGYTTEQICYHCELMGDAKLILVSDSSTYNGDICEMIIERLTSKGHDFVDAARNDTIWNKAKTILKEKSPGVALDVFVQLLKSLTLSVLDLPQAP
jgi:hypothetical protein